MRGIARRLRTTFGISSGRMAIRSQLAWYWRWLLNVLLMVLVATVVWWLVQYRNQGGGASVDELRQRVDALNQVNHELREQLEADRARLTQRDRQHQIEAATQSELARSVAQLEQENASLKEDLGFLRGLMSSGATPEGLAVSELRIEHGGNPNEYRYHLLLTQGGQRKQDFKGRLQLVAHVLRGTTQASLTFPSSSAEEAASAFEFRIYRKVDGRFVIPDGSTLRSVDVRILALPGGQVKLSRTVNLP